MAKTPSSIRVISDTHGLLRPEAAARLRGAEAIIHAGDVGTPEVLAALRKLSRRVIIVRGNVDSGHWAEALPDNEAVTLAGLQIYVLHDLDALDFDPAAAGFAAVISGHSHRPVIERRCGVLYLNPGSAGPRRFSLPICMASLRIDPANGQLDAEIHEL